MLYLIGTGIWDEKDISIRGIEEIKKVEEVYLEKYTNNTGINIENLENEIKKKVKIVSREEVEDTHFLLNEAKKKDIALLIPGDVFSATTHIQYVSEGNKKGIKIKIIHSSSIFTAIANTGLSLYRFGRVISIPYPQENYFPTQYYEHIKHNIKTNLHTLALLDIKMRIPQAIDILKRIDKEKIIFKDKEEKDIVACYALGSDKEKIYFSSPSKIKNITKSINDKAQCIIIPANLEFYEKEVLELYKVR